MDVDRGTGADGARGSCCLCFNIWENVGWFQLKWRFERVGYGCCCDPEESANHPKEGCCHNQDNTLRGREHVCHLQLFCFLCYSPQRSRTADAGKARCRRIFDPDLFRTTHRRISRKPFGQLSESEFLVVNSVLTRLGYNVPAMMDSVRRAQ